MQSNHSKKKHDILTTSSSVSTNVNGYNIDRNIENLSTIIKSAKFKKLKLTQSKKLDLAKSKKPTFLKNFAKANFTLIF